MIVNMTVLTYSKVSVNTSIASSSGQILVLPVRYVLVSSAIPIFLGQAEVDDIYKITLFAQAHQKVVRLYISMNEVTTMDVIYSTYLQQKFMKLKYTK